MPCDGKPGRTQPGPWRRWWPNWPERPTFARPERFEAIRRPQGSSPRKRLQGAPPQRYRREASRQAMSARCFRPAQSTVRCRTAMADLSPVSGRNVGELRICLLACFWCFPPIARGHACRSWQKSAVASAVLLARPANMCHNNDRARGEGKKGLFPGLKLNYASCCERDIEADDRPALS